jgi:hypothetical protein
MQEEADETNEGGGSDNCSDPIQAYAKVCSFKYLASIPLRGIRGNYFRQRVNPLVDGCSHTEIKWGNWTEKGKIQYR